VNAEKLTGFTALEHDVNRRMWQRLDYTWRRIAKVPSHQPEMLHEAGEIR
jgi:hypothetical protein